jgi:hypothetical protein
LFGVYVAEQVMVLPLAAPQVVELYVPALPVPPMVTAPVGAAPVPVHDNCAVIVTAAADP